MRQFVHVVIFVLSSLKLGVGLVVALVLLGRGVPLVLRGGRIVVTISLIIGLWVVVTWLRVVIILVIIPSVLVFCIIVLLGLLLLLLDTFRVILRLRVSVLFHQYGI